MKVGAHCDYTFAFKALLISYPCLNAAEPPWIAKILMKLLLAMILMHVYAHSTLLNCSWDRTIASAILLSIKKLSWYFIRAEELSTFIKISEDLDQSLWADGEAEPCSK